MPDTTTSVIVAGGRTPMGRFMGALRDLSGADLGGVAIRGALDKSGVLAALFEYVIMGQVLTAGAGQIPARQAGGRGRHSDGRAGANRQQGLPVGHRRDCVGRSVDPCWGVRGDRRGWPRVHVAGSASAAERSRVGFKYGDVTIRDSLAFDGLYDIFTDQPMGNLAEMKNGKVDHRISRGPSRTRSRRRRIRMRRGRGKTGGSTTKW